MRLHALQYLRAVAALAVVYSHSVIQVTDYEQYLAHAGSFGVDIFFVISGFIMVYIAKPDDTPGRFIANRIRRVVPLYWFFTFLMASILILMPNVFKATVFQWDTFLMSLAFIPHFSVAYDGYVWPIVAPGWSLVFEMYFYALFALSLLVGTRFRIPLICALIVIVFVIASLNNSGNSALAQFFSESMVFEFILGMALAVAWKKGLRLPSSTAWFLLLFGCSLLFLNLPGPRIVEFGLPSMIIVMSCLYIRIGESELGVLLGDASYALYLSHIFTLGVLRKFVAPMLGDGPMAAYLFVAVSLVACTIVSIFIHHYIDNWLLRRERFQFLNKAPAASIKT